MFPFLKINFNNASKSVCSVAATVALLCIAFSSCKPEPKNLNPRPLDSLGSNKDIVSKQRFHENKTGAILREIKNPYQLALAFSLESKEVLSDTLSPVPPPLFPGKDQKNQLTLGVYYADLAFSAVFGSYQLFEQYLQEVNQYSAQLSIPLKLGEELSNPFNMVPSADSMVAMQRILFIKSDVQIKTAIPSEAAIAITTGAWLESMYQGTLVLKNNPEEKKSILATQKKSLDKLVQLWNLVQSKEAAAFLERLEVLAAIYEKVETESHGEYDSLMWKKENNIQDQSLHPRMSDPVLAAIENEVAAIRQFILKGR